MTYTYDEDIFSDLHKDAYGFRPRGHEFYDSTPARKQEIWDYFCKIVEDNIAAEKEHEARAVRDFQNLVQRVIELGAVSTIGSVNRKTALLWLTSGETFYNEQCVESWVWDKGILFTDYGRALVKVLTKIVTFQEWDAA